jgi:hypothetical protein
MTLLAVLPLRLASGLSALVAIHLPRTLSALLRGGLVHQVQNAEIMLGILEIAFRHHPVAAARRIATQLQVFLEQLLGGAANADIRSTTVEHVVAIERDTATRVVANCTAATAATSAATSARAVIAATQAFQVHPVAVVLSR